MKIDKAKIRYPNKADENQEKSTRPSVFTEKFRGEYYNIDVDKLIPFYRQARKNFDIEALEQMAETVKVHGIRQPLTVIPTEDETGRYEVVSGERRLKAAIMAGLKTVPCIIIHDKKAAVEIALIENVQRKDLHPIELAQAYQQLLDEKICANQYDIARKLGLPRSSISETMKLLTLPESIKEDILMQGIVSREMFRELLEASSPSQMMELLESPARSRGASAKKLKRKVLLKVVLYNDQTFIDTNSLSKLSDQKRNDLKQELLNIL